MKTCIACKITKEITEFTIDSKSRDLKNCRCKECWSEYKRNYSSQYRKKNPEVGRVSVLKWKQRDRKNKQNKSIVSARVFRAIKAGLIKKEPCCVCGAVKSIGHHNDYNKPLVVTWLCPAHHQAWHRVFEAEQFDATKIEIPTSKECCMCGNILPLESFQPGKGKLGRKTYCRKCDSSRSKYYREMSKLKLIKERGVR